MFHDEIHSFLLPGTPESNQKYPYPHICSQVANRVYASLRVPSYF